MKKGKELKINKFKDYNIVYGSVNNKESKAIYINLSGWVEPKSDEELNYRRVIKDLDKKVRQVIYNELALESTMFYKDRTIVDFDIRESGIRYGKRSFTNCELTLFTKYEISINNELIQAQLNNLTETIINNVFDCNKYFKFNKRKK
jgi:hypothetical protein